MADEWDDFSTPVGTMEPGGWDDFSAPVATLEPPKPIASGEDYLAAMRKFRTDREAETAALKAEGPEPSNPGRYLAGKVNQIRSAPEYESLWRQRYAADRIPFAGSMLSAERNLKVAAAAKRIAEDPENATNDDYVAVTEHLVTQEQNADRGFGGNVFDTLTAIPGFAAEMALSGGAFSGGKAATTAALKGVLGKAAETAAGKVATAVVPRAVGLAAQTAAMPSRVAESTSRRVMPTVTQTVDDAGQVVDVKLTDTDKSFVAALPAGFLDTAIEVGSERAGEALTKGAAAIAGKVVPQRVAKGLESLKTAMIGHWLSKPGRSTEALTGLLKAGKWDGIVGEYLEERAGDAARLVTGLESPDENVVGQLASGTLEGAKGLYNTRNKSQYFDLPADEREQIATGNAQLERAKQRFGQAAGQSATELAAFGLMGGTVGAAGKLGDIVTQPAEPTPDAVPSELSEKFDEIQAKAEEDAANPIKAEPVRSISPAIVAETKKPRVQDVGPRSPATLSRSQRAAIADALVTSDLNSVVEQIKEQIPDIDVAASIEFAHQADRLLPADRSDSISEQAWKTVQDFVDGGRTAQQLGPLRKAPTEPVQLGPLRKTPPPTNASATPGSTLIDEQPDTQSRPATVDPSRQENAPQQASSDIKPVVSSETVKEAEKQEPLPELDLPEDVRVDDPDGIFDKPSTETFTVEDNAQGQVKLGPLGIPTNLTPLQTVQWTKVKSNELMPDDLPVGAQNLPPDLANMAYEQSPKFRSIRRQGLRPQASVRPGPAKLDLLAKRVEENQPLWQAGDPHLVPGQVVEQSEPPPPGEAFPVKPRRAGEQPVAAPDVAPTVPEPAEPQTEAAVVTTFADKAKVILGELDARGAPDIDYREAFSTGTKNPLRKGETWRGRLIAAASEVSDQITKDPQEAAASGPLAKRKIGPKPAALPVAQAYTMPDDSTSGKHSDPEAVHRANAPDVPMALFQFSQTLHHPLDLVGEQDLTPQEKDAADFARIHGLEPAFVKSKRGEELPLAGVSHGNIVMLRAGMPENSLWDIVGHEVAHGIGLDAKNDFDRKLIDKYSAGYLEKVAIMPNLREAVQEDRARLRREGSAELVGEFISQPSLRKQILKGSPSFYTQIRDKILQAVGLWSPKHKAFRDVIEAFKAERDKVAGKEPGAKEPAPLYAQTPKEVPDAPMSFGVPVPLKDLEKKIGDAGAWLAKGLKKYFTTSGLLPKEVWEEKTNADHTIAEQMKLVEDSIADLQDAIKENSAGVPVTAAGMATVTDALKGDAAALASLPASVQSAVSAMRTHIDALSRRMIANGLVGDKLELTLDENMGMYVTRSYAMFDHPTGTWKDKVDPVVRNAAHAYILSNMMALPNFPGATFKDFASDAAAKGLIPRFPAGHPQQGMPDARGHSMASLMALLQTYRPSDQEVNNIIDDLLYRQKAPLAMVSNGQLGAKDLSVLKHRKNIAPEIRALFGEYTDPYVNYARSVYKMANAIANHEFLTTIRDAGMGKYFFEEDDPSRPEGFNATIEGGDSMQPLHGLKTSHDISTAFQEAYAKQNPPWWLKNWMRAVLAVKVSKTVLYELVQVRNFTGNPSFALANGHFNLTKLLDATTATKEDIRSSLPQRLRMAVKSDATVRDYVRKMIRLGVLDGSADGGELRESVREANLSGPEFVGNSAVRKGFKLAEKVYQASDNFWKVFGFENERARYKAAYEKAGRPMTDDELDRLAADIITDVYPTYFKIAEGIKQLRRFPITGTFVSFPAEYLRTTFKSVELAIKELNDPVTRSIGATRLGGNLAALAIPSAIALAARYILGFNDDDDKDRRRFVAPWRKNADLMYLTNEGNGDASYVDLSHLFPSAQLRKPIAAMLSGKSMEEAILNGSWEFLQPYIGEDIFTQRLLDVARNTTPEGVHVWKPKESSAKKAEAIAWHFYEALEPGTLTQVRRAGKAITGEIGHSGTKYELWQEGMNATTGLKAETVDIARSLSFKALRYAKEAPETTQVFSSVITSQADISPEEVKAAYDRMEASRKSQFDELHEDVNAAIRLGVPREKVREIFKAGGMSRENVENVLNGKYEPYEISPEITDRAKLRPDAKRRIGAYQQGLDGKVGPERMREMTIENIVGRSEHIMEKKPTRLATKERSVAEERGQTFQQALDEKVANWRAKRTAAIQDAKESGVPVKDIVKAYSKKVFADLNTVGLKGTMTERQAAKDEAIKLRNKKIEAFRAALESAK